MERSRKVQMLHYNSGYVPRDHDVSWNHRKRFKEARLRDVLIQSEVISEGSVERALSRKMYNHAVRCNELVYEALYRLLINKFEDGIDNIEDQIIVDSISEHLSEFASNVSSESFENLKTENAIKQFQRLSLPILRMIYSNMAHPLLSIGYRT